MTSFLDHVFQGDPGGRVFHGDECDRGGAESSHHIHRPRLVHRLQRGGPTHPLHPSVALSGGALCEPLQGPPTQPSTLFHRFRNHQRVCSFD